MLRKEKIFFGNTYRRVRLAKTKQFSFAVSNLVILSTILVLVEKRENKRTSGTK